MDLLSEHGANVLADRIRDYWAGRGMAVNVWIVRQSVKERQGVYGVRSDMIVGCPRNAD